LVVFLLQLDELTPGILVLPQGCDSLADFFRIDLGHQICSDHDGVLIERGVGFLLQNKDQPSGIGSNFVFRYIETVYDGDAFEVDGDLFQGVPFGRLGG
jgi:hypothetical protein